MAVKVYEPISEQDRVEFQNHNCVLLFSCLVFMEAFESGAKISATNQR